MFRRFASGFAGGAVAAVGVFVLFHGSTVFAQSAGRNHCVADSFCGKIYCGDNDCQCCSNGNGTHECRQGPCNTFTY